MKSQPFFPATEEGAASHGLFDGTSADWSPWPPPRHIFDALTIERHDGVEDEASRSLADAMRLHAAAIGLPLRDAQRALDLLDVVEAKTWATDAHCVGLWEHQRSSAIGSVPDEWNYAAVSDGGLQDVVDVLARGIDVRCNTVVSHVDYRRLDGSDVIVHTTSGEQFRADHVVVAVPLAVLKANVISFEPPLPAQLTRAICTVGVGSAIKIVVVLSSPCWPPDLRICFCTNATAPQVWLTPPSLFPGGSFASITGFITGRAAEALAGLDEADRLDRFLTQADAMFATDDDRQPVRARYLGHAMHDWTADPHIRGAYSYPSRLTKDDIDSPQAAFTRPFGPEGRPALAFAGEHAARKADVGTVHGALDAALHAAAEVGGPTVNDDDGTPYFANVAQA